MPATSTPSNLEKRFLQPEGWRWHHLKSDTRKLRFGSVFPKDSIPDAVVVCLPGLSEYAEKYFEIAHDMLDKNYAFWVLDWMGQGLSDRYLPNTHKRHSKSYQQDVEDLHKFILGYIKHSSVHPDKGRIPLAMLSHSMGGNIGMHYLHKYPDIFECAAFSAPMFGIHTLSKFPKILQHAILGPAALLFGKSYAPGGREWSELLRPTPGEDNFSSDPVRGAIHNAWLSHNPDLQIGHVTYRWLYQAAKSCSQLQRPAFLKAIQTHCLLGLAGQDSVVENHAIESAAKALPNAQLLNLPESQHEILMERDQIRNSFLRAFHNLIKERVIDRPEALKPF